MSKRNLENLPGVCLGFLLLIFRAADGRAAEDGFYVGVEAGVSISGDVGISQSGVNHPTRCDTLLYADPGDAPTDDVCTNNDPAALFSNSFGPGAGFAGAATFGYALGSFRFEAEYLNRRQGSEEKPVSLGSRTNDPLATKQSEWREDDPPSEGINDFGAQHFFFNVYYDFRNESRWTPYLGGGVGLGLIEMRYKARFSRKADLGPEEWQRAAAGTVSIIDTNLEGTAFGFQVAGGVDYALSDDVSIGTKIRWTRFRGFEEKDKLWESIRSHAPVRADGTTPFTTDLDLDAISNWTVTGGLKYHF